MGVDVLENSGSVKTLNVNPEHHAKINMKIKKRKKNFWLIISSLLNECKYQNIVLGKNIEFTFLH